MSVPAPEKLLLAAPRGYCAGVDRAVQTVERALEHYGAPVYVRKEIVHNKHVVQQLRERGAIFVDELDDSIPAGATTVFSAHGVSPAVHADAESRRLFTIDRQNDLHRVGTHRQKFDRASPHPGTDLLQRGDHVHPKPHRIIVGTIKRQPAEPLVLARTQSPLRQQRRLAPTRGRTQQPQLAAPSRRQGV